MIIPTIIASIFAMPDSEDKKYILLFKCFIWMPLKVVELRDFLTKKGFEKG